MASKKKARKPAKRRAKRAKLAKAVVGTVLRRLVCDVCQQPAASLSGPASYALLHGMEMVVCHGDAPKVLAAIMSQAAVGVA